MRRCSAIPQAIREGDEVKRTGRIAEVPVGDALLGRVVNALGQPIDEQGPIKATETRRIEIKAPGIIKRAAGQRAAADRHQGDRLDAPDWAGPARTDYRRPPDRQDRDRARHDHQSARPAMFIAFTSQSDRSARRSRRWWKSSIATARWNTPRSLPRRRPKPRRCNLSRPTRGCTMGEYFRDNGRHALLVYDDLSKHAQAYRQLSLLLRRPPGREAYPGDVFYLHSRLLERAAKMSDEYRRRFFDRAADYRDPGGRRLGLYSDQRHLDHRRPDRARRATSSIRASVPRLTSACRFRGSASRPRSRR